LYFRNVNKYLLKSETKVTFESIIIKNDCMNKDMFCNNEFDESALFTVLNEKLFGIGVSEIEGIYNYFRNEFIEEKKDSKKDDVYFKDNIEKVLKINANYNTIPTDAISIGIDFPSWFNYKKENIKIVIVAIDPQRDKKQNPEFLTIGTPYGFQSSRYRGENIYWKLIEKLSEEYSVYLTDTFKVFYYRNGDKSSKLPEFTHPFKNKKNIEIDIHQDLFHEEIKIVNPDLIITLGKEPLIWFSNEKKPPTFRIIKSKIAEDPTTYYYSENRIPILPMPHLSTESRESPLLYSDAKDRSDLPLKYFTIIQNFLSKISEINERNH